MENSDSSASAQSEATLQDTSVIERRPRLFRKKEDQKTMTELADIKKANGLDGFQATDFSYLAKNEYARYDSNSKRIGHAVIMQDAQGDLIAQQYDLPVDPLGNAPILTSLTQFELIERHGQMHYQAKDLNGKKYYSKRSQQIVINQKDKAELAYFSEAEDSDHEPEWGDNRVPAMFHETAMLPNLQKKIKGGHKMAIDSKAVRYRDANRDRGIDQNTVMGMAAEQKETNDATDIAAVPFKNTDSSLSTVKSVARKRSAASNNPASHAKSKIASKSAKQVYEEFFNAMRNELTLEMADMLQRDFNADLHSAPENQHRPEWLHAYAYSFTPEDGNPQLADNLGAASKWVNTEMMVLERVAKWFAIHQTNAQIEILSAFEMVRDSEIIDSVHYELSLKLLNKSIQFMLEVEAFRKAPVFKKASDVAQTVGIGYAILHDHSPTMAGQKITAGPTEEGVARQYEGEPLPGSYPSIEETILEALANKRMNAANALAISAATDLPENNTITSLDEMPPHKKQKSSENALRWQLGNRFFAPKPNSDSRYSLATVVDFETSGLSATKHEIIEIGLISFLFSTDTGVWEVVGHYHALNEPKSPIPPEITKITKIDNAMLAGQQIDWDMVLQFLQRSEFIICHNSQFDRKFFELKAREDVQAVVRSKPFGCTYKDIDWSKRGFESGKLAFLNKQMGFPFVGHRAIKDCWATLNLLLQDPTTLSELVINMKKETVLHVTNPPIEKNELLKEWGYQWSTGKNTRLPKGWWVCLPNQYVETERAWLNQHILNSSKGAKQKGIIEEHDAALDRYAPRMLK